MDAKIASLISKANRLERKADRSSDDEAIQLFKQIEEIDEELLELCENIQFYELNDGTKRYFIEHKDIRARESSMHIHWLLS